MALNDEGAVIQGAYGLANVPSALFKYDKDKDYAGLIVYLQREIAALTYLIREKLPRVKVESHEPTLPEVTERQYKFNLQANSPSGSSGVMTQVWKFTNEDAKNFQKNDFFSVVGMYFDGAHTWSTTFDVTSGTQEIVRVTDVGATDSAGTGYTNVTVTRGWAGDGTGTPAQVTTAMTLVLMTSAVGEGSRSRQSVGKNIVTGSNYVQLFREPYEATDFEMDEDLFYKERPEQVNANLASMLLMKKIEFSFWQGRKSKIVDTTTGRTLYTTGGVIEFIPKDSSHQINFGGVLSATGFNSVAKDIALLGGSEEKWLFGGYSAITALNNAFDNKIRLSEPEVQRYNLNIEEIQSSVGIKLKIVPSFALTELGYDWDFFVLDFGTASTPYFQYMYMDDIYINAGRDGKGIQDNDEFIRKEEFVGKIGLIRRAAAYQAHIYGITRTM